jgi:hypothetical protein
VGTTVDDSAGVGEAEPGGDGVGVAPATTGGNGAAEGSGRLGSSVTALTVTRTTMVAAPPASPGFCCATCTMGAMTGSRATLAAADITPPAVSRHSRAGRPGSAEPTLLAAESGRRQASRISARVRLRSRSSRARCSSSQRRRPSGTAATGRVRNLSSKRLLMLALAVSVSVNSSKTGRQVVQPRMCLRTKV